jgi:hypothetical protein
LIALDEKAVEAPAASCREHKSRLSQGFSSVDRKQTERCFFVCLGLFGHLRQTSVTRYVLGYQFGEDPYPVHAQEIGMRQDLDIGVE